MEVGNYELVRKLAVGGMAEIFLARQKSVGGFQRNVVLKRILPECAEDPAFVAAFLNEATLTAQLSHPNLVQIFDFGQAAGSYFLTMEYIKGFDLEAILRISPNGLPLPIVLAVGRDMASGLDHAHEARDPDGAPLGIIHRDISPANVLVTMEGVSKVVDFGVAKATALTGNRTATGQVKGKAAYLAPEQVLGLPLDRRVDVFALGATLYECLTGRNPFAAGTDFESLTNVVEKEAELLPGAIGTVLARALAKDRQWRFQSCGELLTALESVAVSARVTISHTPMRDLILERKLELETESDRERNARQEQRENADTQVSISLPNMKPATAEMSTRPTKRHEILAGVGAAVVVLLVAAGITWSRRRAAPIATTVASVPSVPISHPVASPIAMPVNTAPPVVATPPDVPIAKPAAVIKLAPDHPLLVTATKTKTPPVRAPKSIAPRVHEVDVAQGEGRVRVVVQPYAQLNIDGQDVGDIPRPPDTLSAGAHTLVITNGELGKKVTRKIVVIPGEEVLIRINLLEN